LAKDNKPVLYFALGVAIAIAVVGLIVMFKGGAGQATLARTAVQSQYTTYQPPDIFIPIDVPVGYVGPDPQGPLPVPIPTSASFVLRLASAVSDFNLAAKPYGTCAWFMVGNSDQAVLFVNSAGPCPINVRVVGSTTRINTLNLRSYAPLNPDGTIKPLSSAVKSQLAALITKTQQAQNALNSGKTGFTSSGDYENPVIWAGPRPKEGEGNQHAEAFGGI